MKTIDEMLKLDSCGNIKCYECPFELEEYNEKYYKGCKAHIYCKKNNIGYHSLYDASEIYIKYLKEERKLLLQEIMQL